MWRTLEWITGRFESSAKPVGPGHFVQLYGRNDRLLAHDVSRYLATGMRRGDGSLVIATAVHRAMFLAQLERLDIDACEAQRSGRLTLLDADETLARFTTADEPQWDSFERTLLDAFNGVRFGSPKGTIRAYGEMVGILWEAGRREAALRLEEFWNRLLATRDATLYCAYPVDVFSRDFHLSAVDGIFCAHSHLIPTAPDENLAQAIDRSMQEVLGWRFDGVRRLMKANFRPAWASIPTPEARILWLRNNLPAPTADDILSRARGYYEAHVLR